MTWEEHLAPELEAKCGPGGAAWYAEKLRAVLEHNGLSLPRFPGMVWAEDRLPGGESVVVGIGEGDGGPLVYLFPAGRVTFTDTREETVERPVAEGEGPAALTLHWFTPRR